MKDRERPGIPDRSPFCLMFTTSSGGGVPFHDNHDIGDRRVCHRTGQRRNNRAVTDGGAAAAGVARSGQIAARDGRGDQRLGAGVGGIGGFLLASADGEGEADLIAVHFRSGERVLIRVGGYSVALVFGYPRYLFQRFE